MIGIGGDVLEELRILIELQKADAEIYRLEKERERLPRLVHFAGETLRASQADRDQAQAAADEAGREKRAVEQELQAETEHLRKLKLRSSEIKTNKEYFAHLKEIEECQKKVGKLEETSLELMDKVEKADAELAGKNNSTAEEEARFAESKVSIEKKFEDGDRRLVELKAARAELLSKITKEHAEHYGSMQKAFPDSTVSEAKDGTCTGCRMTIPPQTFNNVKKGEMIISCSNCHRILFYREAL